MSDFMQLDATERNQNLSQPESEAVMLLLAGKSVREISVQLDRPLRTVYYWLAKPEVKALIRSYRAGQLVALATTAQNSAESAMRLLVDTVENEAQPLAFRLRAAERLLNTSMQLSSQMDDAERIDELEKSVRELLTQARAY